MFLRKNDYLCCSNLLYAMSKTVITLFLALFSLAGQAQVMNSIGKKLCEITHSKTNVTCTAILSDQYDKTQTDANEYDFCEENADGDTLYYRYIEQDYCELVAAPEKYTGVIRIPAFVTERQLPVVGVGIMAFYDCDGLTEVYLPQTMLYLESASFCYCYHLQKVELNDNLIAIGWNAFEGCDKLSTINIPQSLEYVGYEAFFRCSKLTTPLYNDKYFFHYPDFESNVKVYTIPEGIEVIGEGAFIFTFLNEVKIPNSVKTISDYAFDGSQLQKVNIPTSIETIGKQAFGQTRLREIVVPTSVKSFGTQMFTNASWLEKAILHNPLDSIPSDAFYNCTSLKEVSFPASVYRIGNYAFHGCSSLPQLPDLTNICSLGVEAFYGCNSLSSVSLPSAITQIPDGAFTGCFNLKDVHLPENIKSIGTYAFYQNSMLESIQIPKTVRSIGHSAFSFCKRLKNIELQEGLVSIGDFAFSQLEALESISLPASLENLGLGVFCYDYKLKDVFTKREIPIELQQDPFFISQSPLLYVILHVPAGSANSYRTAQYWSDFSTIVEEPTGINIQELSSDSKHSTTPVKRIINGVIGIETESGIVLTDGRRLAK